MADQTTPQDPQIGAIMKGFRTQYPDYSDMSDDDVLIKMHQKYYSDIDPKEYISKLTSKFAPDYKTTPTLGDRVVGAGKALAAIPGQFVKGLASSVTAPAQAIQANITGRQLEKTAAGIPEPDFDAMQEKGYNYQQMRNVEKGYAATQESLMGDVAKTGQEGVEHTAEGAALFATLPLGGEGAGIAHAVGTGALLGAGYGAIDEGIKGGATAAATGAPAGQIFDEITKHTVQGGIEGAKYGAIGGAALHGIGSAFSGATRAVGDGITAIQKLVDPQWAARKAVADASAISARAAGLSAFAQKFQPQMLLDRFKPDFDAWQKAAEQGAPPEQLAATIAAKLYGADAMGADAVSVKTIADKITPWLKTNEKLFGPLVDIPQYPEGSAMGTPQSGAAIPNTPMAATMPNQSLPPGADLNQQGGLAPEQTPPGIAGPMGQPGAPQFTPPAEGTVPQMPGLEGPPAPQQAQPGMPQQGLAPTPVERPAGQAPSSPNPLMPKPLDIERLPSQTAPEINPKFPENAPAPLPTGKPAGRVEPITLNNPTKPGLNQPESAPSNPVVSDPQVVRALGFKLPESIKATGPSPSGVGSYLTEPQQKVFSQVAEDVARSKGQTVQELQASIKPGSTIRPFKDVSGKNPVNLTPLQWVDKNRVTSNELSAASEGVEATRQGGGFTYDPYTFKKLDTNKGIVVSLASKKVPTDQLNGSDVIDFTKRFKRLTDAYYGVNVGTFNLEKYEPGMSSIDFNVVLPKEMIEQAKTLGKQQKQVALWDLEKGEEIPTGYTGPSATLPDNNWDKMLTKIEDIMTKLDLPGRAMKSNPGERVPDPFAAPGTLSSTTLEAMTRTPHRWIEYAEQSLDKKDTEVKALVDAGKLTPMSDYNMTNSVVVQKDGSVWQYTNPVAPDYTIIKKIGDFRKTPQDMLNYVADKDIIHGNDIVQQYKTQGGFLSLKKSSPKIAPSETQASKIVPSMLKYQGKMIPNLSVFKTMNPSGMSLWISPEGKVIQVPFHLRSAERVVSALKLKNPVTYIGSEHSEMQTILNHGFIRVQMHGDSYAADAALPLTDAQIISLKALRPGPKGPRDFSARLNNTNGEFRDFYQGDRAIHNFIEAAGKEGK